MPTLEKLVLADLQRVFGTAKENEAEFFGLLQTNVSDEIKKVLSIKTIERDEGARRIKKLDKIIQRLYEDNVRGKITDERFKKLSKTYEEEQIELTERAEMLNKELSAVKKRGDNTAEFMRLVRGYMEIIELTPEIVRTFIEKIIVYEKQVRNAGGHNV